MAYFVDKTTIVEENVEIGDEAKVWHRCHLRSGSRLGFGVSLGGGVYIDKNVSIGRCSRIQNGVSVYAGVEVGEWCFIGPHVVFTNDLVPRAGLRDWKIVPTILEDGMALGAGSIVVCGVRVGAFSVTGAGSVVTADIPPFHLVTGTPARITKMVCACARTFLPIGTPPR